MSFDLPQEQLADAVDGSAEEVLWEAGVEAPPVNPFFVARQLGLTVVTDATLETRGVFCTVAPGGLNDRADLIRLGPEDRHERRCWAVSHEIGERTAHRVFERLGVCPREAPPGSRERIANAFAGRLLAPSPWLRADAGQVDWDLAELKRVYATASHELLVRRALELTRSPWIATVFDRGGTTWRRTNYGRRAPGLAAVERRVWLACHDRAEPTLQEGGAPGVDRVRCWPVHEPDWRREIMLTELVDFD